MAQLQFRSDDTIKWKEGFGTALYGDQVVTTSQNFYVNNGSQFSGVNAPTYATIVGTAGNYTATTTDRHGWYSTWTSNGEPCIIHQMTGSGTGTWQFNVVTSIPASSGSYTTTFKYPLTYSFNTSGSTIAMVVKIPQYRNFTVNSGVTLSAPSWDGVRWGFLPIFAKKTITINGTLNASGKGFRGPTNRSYSMNGESAYNAWTGEGYTRNSVESTAANASGGAGGNGGDGGGGGGGGGHATTGTVGQAGQGGTAPGGTASGNSSLTLMTPGGGGGSGRGESSANCVPDRTYYAGLGSAGGAIILLVAKEIIVGGNILSSGSNGLGAYGACEEGAGGGGGGAGGSILVKAEDVTFGSEKTVAVGGSGGAGNGGSHANGGAGSVGRIHLDYSGSYSGTTNPVLNATLDSTIKDIGGSNFFAFL